MPADDERFRQALATSSAIDKVLRTALYGGPGSDDIAYALRQLSETVEAVLQTRS